MKREIQPLEIFISVVRSKHGRRAQHLRTRQPHTMQAVVGFNLELTIKASRSLTSFNQMLLSMRCLRATQSTRSQGRLQAPNQSRSLPKQAFRGR